MTAREREGKTADHQIIFLEEDNSEKLIGEYYALVSQLEELQQQNPSDAMISAITEKIQKKRQQLVEQGLLL